MADFHLTPAQLDAAVAEDAAEESSGQDARLDAIAAWHTSDERAQYEAAYAYADRRAASRLSQQEEDALAAAQAERLIKAVVESATEQEWLAVAEVYVKLVVAWERLGKGAVQRHAGAAEDYPVLVQTQGRTSSLPSWTLEGPSQAILDVLPLERRSLGRSNLALVLLFLFQLEPRQIKYFLASCQSDTPLDIKCIVRGTDASRAPDGECVGVYAFSFDKLAWYIGRVAAQFMVSRMEQHGSHGVNRIIRQLLESNSWASARKGVLLSLPAVHKGLPVPAGFFTRILEPIYIAFARSTVEGPRKMQFNIFDNMGYEAKASVRDVIDGFAAACEYSHGTTSGRENKFRFGTDYAWYESTFGAAFGNTVRGQTISKIINGIRRGAITSRLPPPAKTAYSNPPETFFPAPATPKSKRKPLTPSPSPSRGFNFVPPAAQSKAKQRRIQAVGKHSLQPKRDRDTDQGPSGKPAQKRRTRP